MNEYLKNAIALQQVGLQQHDIGQVFTEYVYSEQEVHHEGRYNSYCILHILSIKFLNWYTFVHVDINCSIKISII